MNTRLPCVTDSDEFRFEPDDQFADGPELEAPVWLKSAQYISAVEKSAKVDEWGLCRVWGHWRDSGDLRMMLHGFLMITSLRTFDAAWIEIDLLREMIEEEVAA